MLVCVLLVGPGQNCRDQPVFGAFSKKAVVGTRLPAESGHVPLMHPRVYAHPHTAGALT